MDRIENIVFDMGNVLVNYDPLRVCRHYMQDGEEIRRVHTAVFVSPEWLMLDMGLISEEEALGKMQSRLDTEHEKEMAALCMAHWHEFCMEPAAGMEALVRELKGRGFGIYLCSNASLRLLQCFRQVIPAIDCFDGVLFSAEVKCMKPQAEMYRHLYQRFGLRPETCLFIDDLPANAAGAQATGMRAYCYADGNLEKLKAALSALY